MIITFLTIALLTSPVQSQPRQPMLAPQTEVYNIPSKKKGRK